MGQESGSLPKGRRAAGAGGATVAILLICLVYLGIVWKF